MSFFPSDYTEYAGNHWFSKFLLRPTVLPSEALSYLKAVVGSQIGAYVQLIVNGKKAGEKVSFKVAAASVEKKLGLPSECQSSFRK